MHVITQARIREAKEKWPHASNAFDIWHRLMRSAAVIDFAGMKAVFPSVDKVGQLHVFDVGGNKCRIVAAVHYNTQKVYIRHMLDHAAYEKGKWKD